MFSDGLGIPVEVHLKKHPLEIVYMIAHWPKPSKPISIVRVAPAPMHQRPTYSILRGDRMKRSILQKQRFGLPLFFPDTILKSSQKPVAAVRAMMKPSP
jgi:hypothetical protein